MTPTKNDTCERCGFVPIDLCQLDVIDIVGRSEVADPSNFVTLCVNCQRLKEAMSGGYLSPGEREALKDIWREGYLFN